MLQNPKGNTEVPATAYKTLLRVDVMEVQYARAINRPLSACCGPKCAHRLCMEGGLVCLLVLLLTPMSLRPSRTSKLGTAGPKAAWGSCHQCTAGAWELLRPLLCPAARLSCPEAGRAWAVMAAAASSTCVPPLLNTLHYDATCPRCVPLCNKYSLAAPELYDINRYWYGLQHLWCGTVCTSDEDAPQNGLRLCKIKPRQAEVVQAGTHSSSLCFTLQGV